MIVPGVSPRMEISSSSSSSIIFCQENRALDPEWIRTLESLDPDPDPHLKSRIRIRINVL